MKKTNPILMLMAIFVVIFATACGGKSSEPTAVNTVNTAPLVLADTNPVDTYCVEKIPYQNILLEPGVNFEITDSSGELKCADSGTDVDGKNVITCTGKELWTSDLKIVSSSGSGTMKVNMGACPLPSN